MAANPGGGVVAPDLPPGEPLHLPDRGTTFIRQLHGPPGAPTVVLLHGWTATADLNWFTCYYPLAQHFRVIAIDHRGHGRGIRSRTPFRLTDCADDVVAVCDELGIHRFIPVGYSMGGPVAQLVWKQHPHRVQGLVLCATAAYFSTTREEKMAFLGLSGMAALARLTPSQTRKWLSEQFYLQRKTSEWEDWAVQEASLHDWRAVLEAGRAIGNYTARDWIGGINVPTSTLITMRDHVVPVRRQVRLFEAIHGAEAYRVDGDHDAVVANADRFVPTLIRAIRSVAERSDA